MRRQACGVSLLEDTRSVCVHMFARGGATSLAGILQKPLGQGVQKDPGCSSLRKLLSLTFHIWGGFVCLLATRRIARLAPLQREKERTREENTVEIDTTAGNVTNRLLHLLTKNCTTNTVPGAVIDQL